ncbi:MAG: hypothetical protein KGL10_02500, partial [Alphaproteobacteria bacterium]|nr:hypothetical protein [Alphaproteobacteria bacterium]
MTTVQGAAAANQPKGKAGGASSAGLLGFFDAILQQINATLQTNGQLTAAQNASATAPDLKGFTEKIAALLKKDGVTSADIAKMSPQDLATKVSQLLQSQNVALPATLQNIPTQDLSTQLATLLQNSNGATLAAAVKPALTSDLTAQSSANVQSAPQTPPTKNDIAQKISGFLEKHQKTADAAPVTPAQLATLKGEIAQLQSA